MIKFDYSGVIELTPSTVRAMTRSEDAKTTDFGDASKYSLPIILPIWTVSRVRVLITVVVVTHVRFETGSDELRALEQKLFVASGRFVIEEGNALVVEYKISQVSA